MNVHEDDWAAQERYLAQFDVPTLTREEILEKSEEEIKQHEEQRLALATYKEELKQALLDYDHYEHGMRILDTDYKNYMLLYHCIEDYPEVTENETSHDVHSKFTHQRSISILLRDPNSYD